MTPAQEKDKSIEDILKKWSWSLEECFNALEEMKKDIVLSGVEWEQLNRYRSILYAEFGKMIYYQTQIKTTLSETTTNE